MSRLFLLVWTAFYVNMTCVAQSSCSVPPVTLKNGVEMPILQLGTSHLIHLPNNSDNNKYNPNLPANFVGMLPERSFRQVQVALEHGIRAFDTALIYRSHKQLGHVLAEWWRQGLLTSREDVWITSKVFHPDASGVAFQISHMPDMASMTPEHVAERTREHFERSLHELGVGYVDLMLLHWPSGRNQGDEQLNRKQRLAAWNVLETMYARGWARAIGVSNFSPKHLEQLKQDGAAVVPMVNQIEASVTLQHTEILQYCKENAIVPQAYSPLGRGLNELPAYVSELAEKYQKDAGQIVFRYLYQLGYSIVYLTRSEKRMQTNNDIFDFHLTGNEMNELGAFSKPDGGWGLPSPFELD